MKSSGSILVVEDNHAADVPDMLDGILHSSERLERLATNLNGGTLKITPRDAGGANGQLSMPIAHV
ncbi:MAG: hypothetical protein HY736_19015 [Verrucomicrobia bacterium]|nr:hypothetical protein [Verrucomicrobiota bacterium]